MTQPTVEQLAWMICDHLDREASEVNPPTESDYELARKIRDRIDTATYLDRQAERMHGYHTLARRLLGVLIIGVLALILVLTHAWSAA
jgi:hypothetical protein